MRRPGITSACPAPGWLRFRAAPPQWAKAAAFNTRGRKEVETDFSGRRLVLPSTLAAGQTLDGSLFFPVTPGPKTLIFHCRAAGQTTDVALLLTPLAGLHVKDPAKP
jgi:hypothetical protein